MIAAEVSDFRESFSSMPRSQRSKASISGFASVCRYAPGSSVARVARESGINANQLFTWRKQFGAMPSALTESACQLLPVIALDSVAASSPKANIAAASSTSGAILLTVGPAQLRLEGAVDQATLAQVLARLLP